MAAAFPSRAPLQPPPPRTNPPPPAGTARRVIAARGDRCLSSDPTEQRPGPTKGNGGVKVFESREKKGGVLTGTSLHPTPPHSPTIASLGVIAACPY